MQPLALHRMRAKLESLSGRNIPMFKINMIDETFRLECAGLLPRCHSYYIVSLFTQTNDSTDIRSQGHRNPTS